MRLILWYDDATALPCQHGTWLGMDPGKIQEAGVQGMSNVVAVNESVRVAFEQAMEAGRVVYFSAPCGFGKTATIDCVLAGWRVLRLDASDPAFELPADAGDGTWDVLVIDHIPDMLDDELQGLCALIRSLPEKRFVLESRSAVPGVMLSFQYAGLLTPIGTHDLMLDRQATAKVFEAYGVEPTTVELSNILAVSHGYPLGINILARRMAEGAPWRPETADLVRREIFSYYDEAVFRQFDKPTRRMLMKLAPFNEVEVELVVMVTGDNAAGEMLSRVLRKTSMFIQDRLGRYRFWPIFKSFLEWELYQCHSAEQVRDIFDRGGIYYELHEDYGNALACYSKSGNHRKISELLERNAELHPGAAHYSELERYYLELPDAEILASPALMQAMSMLCAIKTDYEGSERWYRALRDYGMALKRSDVARKEVRSRLAWLDIALPQRPVEALAETIPAVVKLMMNHDVELTPFSVTSNLPSIMNGGKDFSEWSRRDDVLYATLKRPVEVLLGRDGVGLPDAAVAESKFEKGEDVMTRLLSLMSRLTEIRRSGTPDIEFAVVGLLIRAQVAAGRPGDAREALASIKESFSERGLVRFGPTIAAMECRLALHVDDDATVEAWLAAEAPRDPLNVHVMKRYLYLTKAMAELATGDPRAALLTLAPLGRYVEQCHRHLDGISLSLLAAIAHRRLDDPAWRDDVARALDEACPYRFVRPVAQFGTAVLPLLDACGWDRDGKFLKRLVAAAREQAAYYPDFLEPRRDVVAPLSGAELQVLRLLCADKSNAEICAVLDIQLATVKTHVSKIFRKLGVNRRTEAKTKALKLHLV